MALDFLKVRARVQKDLVAHSKMFAKIATRTDGFWLKFQSRSVLQTTLTHEVVQTLVKNVNVGELMPVIKKIFSNFGHSGVIEDCFQRMRSIERANEGGTKVTANRLWKCPSDTKLLTSIYDYREVDQTSVPEKKNESLPNNFFKATLANTTVPLTEVAGKSPSPPWPSFSPPLLQFSEDLGVLAALHDKPDANPWRTVFLFQHLVCRNKKSDSDQRFLSFGSSSLGNCCLLWPVVETTLFLAKKTLHIWKLKEITEPAELKWKPVLDFGDWLVTPTEYVSPMHIFAENKCEVPSSFHFGGMVQCGPETPLLKHAAQQGFWNLNLQTLRKLCKDFV